MLHGWKKNIKRASTVEGRYQRRTARRKSAYRETMLRTRAPLNCYCLGSYFPCHKLYILTACLSNNCDKQSVMVWCPSKYFTLELNATSSHRSIQAFGRHFLPYKISNELWPVTSSKSTPYRWMWNCSDVRTTVIDSFSVVKQLRSAGVSGLLL